MMQVVRLLTVAAFAGSSRHLPISPIHLASNGCWVWLVAARTNSTLQGTVNILLRASETQTHTEGLDRGEVWSYRAQKEAESGCGGEEGMGQQHKNPCKVSQYQSTAILEMRISETTARQTPRVALVPVCIPPAKSKNLNPAGKKVVEAVFCMHVHEYVCTLCAPPSIKMDPDYRATPVVVLLSK